MKFKRNRALIAAFLVLAIIFSMYACEIKGGKESDATDSHATESQVEESLTESHEKVSDVTEEGVTASSSAESSHVTETDAKENTSATETEKTTEGSESDETTEKPTEGSESDETTEKPTESSEKDETVESTTAKTEETTEDLRFEKEYAPVHYMDAKYIAKIAKEYEWGANNSNMLGGYLSKDKSYVTLIPFDGEQEASFYLFDDPTVVGPIMVVKYRTVHQSFYMEFFMNSYDSTAQRGCNVNVRGLRTDGEWDIKVVDLNEKLPHAFVGNKLCHLRFDFANGDPIPPECEIDIAYVAFFNSASDAYKFEYGEDYVAPEDPEDTSGDKNATLFFDALDIDSAAKDFEAKNLDSATLSGDLSFVTLKPKNNSGPDGYVNLLESKKSAARYFAIKYRTEDLGYWIEVFTDSVNTHATAGSSFTFYPINDGEWHVLVIDLQEKLGDNFNGESLNYIRFDFMNSNDKLGDWSLDVEYIGFYADETLARGKDYDPNAPVNIFTAEDIKAAIDAKNTGIASATLSKDGDYLTVEAATGASNAYAYIFTSKRAAGRYLIVKYRTESKNFYTQLWMNSGAYTAGAAKITMENFATDGTWQYGIYDLAEALGDGQYNGQYLAHFRYDFMHQRGDQPAPAGITYDVAYFAFFDSLEAAEAYAGINNEPDEPTETESIETESAETETTETESTETETTETETTEPDIEEIFNATEIIEAAKNNGSSSLASATPSEDNSYVTLKPVAGKSADAYIKLLNNQIKAYPYFAIKYRTTDLGYWIEVFTDSVNEGAVAGSSFTFYPINDGEWHVFVIDLTKAFNSEKFNGESVNYIRFDFMNCNDKLGDWSIDVEYLGFFATETEAKGKDYDPNAPVNIFTAEDIKAAIDKNNTGIASATLSENGEYLTVESAVGVSNAYAYIFTEKKEAGRYLVVKFKTESKNFYTQLWMNSGAYTAGAAKITMETFATDGTWQYGIFDLTQALGEGQYNGQYLAHFRYDFMHQRGDKPAPEGITYDVAYFAFFDSLEAAEAYTAK